MMATADLCDHHGDAVRVLVGGFVSYGAVGVFRGPISTLDVFEDNSLVRDALEEPGEGRVLMVAGVDLTPGTWLWAAHAGIVVADRDLEATA